MRRFSSRIFLLSAIFATPSSLAQLMVESLTPNPTVIMSEGTSLPAHSVSTMKIVNGEWTIKPVYRIENGNPHVVGMLAFVRPGNRGWFEPVGRLVPATRRNLPNLGCNHLGRGRCMGRDPVDQTRIGHSR